MNKIEPPITVSNSLQSNIEDWNRERSLWTALDGVGGAIVENRLDLAVDALHQVRIDPQTPPAALAMIDDHEGNHSDEELFDLSMLNGVLVMKSEQVESDLRSTLMMLLSGSN